MSPGHKKQVVEAAVKEGVCSGRAGCRILGLSRSGYWYRAGRRSSRQQELVKRIHALADEEPRYGYRRIAAVLKEEGWNVGKRQVRRLRRMEGLRVPPTKKKVPRRGRSTGLPTKATHRNHVWTWDFIADATVRGGSLRTLSVLDECTRECHVLRADRALKSGDVIDLVKGAIVEHGAPEFIRSDNGSEFIAKELQRWLAENKIKTIYIEPGSPWQNGFVESFHGRFRDECLNREQLWTLTASAGRFSPIRAWARLKRKRALSGCCRTKASKCSTRDAMRHATSSMAIRTAVALSGPPRRTARDTTSCKISSSESSRSIRSVSSESRTRRVTPSVQKR